MKLETVRKIALALPEVVEAPHFDRTSFRVNNRIFATAPYAGDTLNLFLDEVERQQALALHSPFVEPLWWGKKICGVTVNLAAADRLAVQHLLRNAWLRRAPKRARRVEKAP